MATLVRSLVNARGYINHQWPHRDHSSDGWIGDDAHKLVHSDHNPDAAGRVHAIDVDKDGIHIPTVLAAFMLAPATHYVIHNRRIWQAEDHFLPRKYTGDNPHTGHIHESVWHNDFARNWAGPWTPLGGLPSNIGYLSEGAHGSHVTLAQAYLNAYWFALRLDADFGPATDKAVRMFQSRHGLKVDGIVGPRTWNEFRTGHLV